MMLRSIGQKADVLATLRFISVFLMETLARWTPLTPELELKVLFGRHLWEFAQHADALGQRSAELRAGLHYTRPPVAAYRGTLDEIAGFQTSAERVHGFYEVLVPEVARRYQAVLHEADVLLDQPTIRIVERILQDLTRLQRERHDMLAGIEVPSVSPEWTRRLQERFGEHVEFVDFRPVKEATA